MKLKNLLPEGIENIQEADILSASEKAAKAAAKGKDKPYSETIDEASTLAETDKWLDWFNKDRPSQIKNASTDFRKALASLRGVRDMMETAGSTAKLNRCITQMTDAFDDFQDGCYNLKTQFIEGD
jgi:hypothetical protein